MIMIMIMINININVNILTQCSLSPGNSERGARGRLVCLQSHTYSLTHSLQSLLVNHPRSGQVENAEVWKCRSTNTGVRKRKYGRRSTETPEYRNRSTETVSVLSVFHLPPRSRALQTTHMHAHTLWYPKRDYQG